ncbi:hypothetical protein J2I47_22575 [Fibrella sp. HMF5335]|uniref:Tetratricopeptide repeat protein n=2 Tax=Fibrella rubiginis TaxID=2817060 RepID=A0A939K7F3_9BACT|nr:hypothetical protein [Fibrella rubiginis]
MWGLLLLPVLAVGQAQTPVMVSASRAAKAAANAKTVTAPKETAKTADVVTNAVVERVIDVKILPLFGERSKSPLQIEDEIRFLNDCDQNFTSRHEASQFFAARGWEYIAEAQLDTAAYRFNLANLLDDKNADAFWGLGVVSYQRNQLGTAIKMLQRGASLADTNAVLLTDLATVELEQYQAKQDTASMVNAREHLARAIFLRPDHATAYMKLSLANYLEAKYGDAWLYLHKAYTTSITSVDLDYVHELLAKQPDPIGLFK